MSVHFSEEDLTLNDKDLSAQSLLALKSCSGIFNDAVTSDAFICTVSLVTIRKIL
jgi:hypothetical protein